MSERSISVSDLSFVRDVLIPRCSYVEGPEVNLLVQLRLRIDAIFTDIEVELAAGRPESIRFHIQSTACRRRFSSNSPLAVIVVR